MIFCQFYELSQYNFSYLWLFLFSQLIILQKMTTVELENSFKTFHQQSRLINVRKRLMQKLIVIGDYRVGKKIGSGAYGSVYQAYKIQGGQKLAVKIVNITDQNSQYVKNQIEICQKIGHENIVKIFDVLQQEQKIYIFMQYCENGQLFEFIKKNGPLNEETAGKMFIQLHSALKYLHLKGIAHRDIKAQNVLLDEQMNVKLIDFGLSKQYDKQQPMLDTFCGSPAYVPPEIVKKRKYIGQMVDVWCLGVTLYIMLEAAQPFFSHSNADTKIKIVNYQWSTMENASDQAKELIKMIFNPPNQRISLKQIQSTSFYQKFSMKKMRRFESRSTNSTQKTQRLSTGDGVQLILPEIIHRSTKKIGLLRNMKSKINENQFDGVLSSNNSLFKPSKSRNLLVGRSNQRARTKNDEIILTMTPKKNICKIEQQDLALFKRQVVSTLKKY